MIQLRPHQIAAADAVENAWRSGVARPLIDACVGSGKSLILAEVARRALLRGERSIILAHTQELVEQNASACRALMPGTHIGINSESLGERTWRAPVISAQIQSVHRAAPNFGPIENIGIDESHLVPHSEAGMYHRFTRGFPGARVFGASGTVFRLQGGSLVEGEQAPFDRVVYRYSILDGIRDGYLVPAFSAEADDKIDVSKLRTRQGEYTGDSQDAQMLELMDNHIMQMVHHGADRRAWLVFEASTKAARAIVARLNEWRIPSGLVLGDTPKAERKAIIEAYRNGRLRCLVNVAALTTGFDVPAVDMLVMRRRTKSLGLYIQMTGRLLRTIGGNIESSIAAGKPDGLVLDFGGNIDQHGPLDFIRPKSSKVHLATCECCGKCNPSAARNCWACGALMTKLCPACLTEIPKGTLDCPHCQFDMRVEQPEEPKGPKLLQTPSGAALIAAFKPMAARAGGWIPVRRAYDNGQLDDVNGTRWDFASDRIADARWIRDDGSAILVLNGLSRSSALQISRDGSVIVVPMPAKVSAAA